jgi:hypothetical protein
VSRKLEQERSWDCIFWVSHWLVRCREVDEKEKVVGCSHVVAGQGDGEGRDSCVKEG